MNLLELLSRYKELTIEIINKIDSDIDISELLNIRQDVLKKILALDNDKSEMKNFVESLKIQDYEEKAQSLIKDKMVETRKEIKKLKQSQAAYNKYNNFTGNAMIFSTQR